MGHSEGWTMRIRVLFMILAVSISMVQVRATTVEWNLMHSEYSYLPQWGLGEVWHVLGGNVERGVLFEFFLDEAQCAVDFGPSQISVWVRQMRFGEVVDGSSMRGEGLTYFYQAEKGKEIRSDYVLSEPNTYLAMCVESMTLEPYYAYGWVELSGADVVSSAWDLDGGPMIVGGGSALTPEPSSTLLLLVGGALLALRRRAVA